MRRALAWLARMLALRWLVRWVLPDSVQLELPEHDDADDEDHWWEHGDGSPDDPYDDDGEAPDGYDDLDDYDDYGDDDLLFGDGDDDFLL